MINNRKENAMDTEKLLSKVDHTLLSVDATWDKIKSICGDGIKYGTASVCIPPSYVKKAKAYVGDRIKICTVIGFPNGYSTEAVKCFEAADAVQSGADEVDMVINIGKLKDGLFDEIFSEIRAVREAVDRVKTGIILKVIVETCLLTEEEKVKMCGVVSSSGADYIKTSTGFSTGGATFDDIRLFRENVSEGLKIKAAGGISSLEDAEKFIELGADRLGTSKIVKIIKSENQNENERKAY